MSTVEPEKESCYWILLASKRCRKLLVRRIKERKKNKERRKEGKGTPREQKEYMVGVGLLCPRSLKGFEKRK